MGKGGSPHGFHVAETRRLVDSPAGDCCHQVIFANFQASSLLRLHDQLSLKDPLRARAHQGYSRGSVCPDHANSNACWTPPHGCLGVRGCLGAGMPISTTLVNPGKNSTTHAPIPLWLSGIPITQNKNHSKLPKQTAISIGPSSPNTS